jgi:hypothetical protein
MPKKLKSGKFYLSYPSKLGLQAATDCSKRPKNKLGSNQAEVNNGQDYGTVKLETPSKNEAIFSLNLSPAPFICMAVQDSKGSGCKDIEIHICHRQRRDLW